MAIHKRFKVVVKDGDHTDKNAIIEFEDQTPFTREDDPSVFEMEVIGDVNDTDTIRVSMTREELEEVQVVISTLLSQPRLTVVE